MKPQNYRPLSLTHHLFKKNNGYPASPGTVRPKCKINDQPPKPLPPHRNLLSM